MEPRRRDAFRSGPTGRPQPDVPPGTARAAGFCSRRLARHRRGRSAKDGRSGPSAPASPIPRSSRRIARSLSLDALLRRRARGRRAAGTAVVGAGTRLGTLARGAARHGLALAPTSETSIGGRRSPAPSPRRYARHRQSRSEACRSQIVAMTIVDGTGRVRQLDADRDRSCCARRARRARCPRRDHVHHAEGAASGARCSSSVRARRWRNCCAIWTRSLRANHCASEFFWFPRHGLPPTARR